MIIDMLADDKLGRTRENPDPADPVYAAGLAEIIADANNRLILVERDGEAVGMFHLTVIPSVSIRAGKRLHVESVRVRSDLRGQGIGRAMMDWAADQARAQGCIMVQLMTNTARSDDALKFYESCGFQATHYGLKLSLV